MTNHEKIYEKDNVRRNAGYALLNRMLTEPAL